MLIIGVALGLGLIAFAALFLMDKKNNLVKQEPEKTKLPKAELNVNNDTGLTDYSIYHMAAKERILYILLAALILVLIGFIFYNNIIIAFLLAILSIFFPKFQTKRIIEKRQHELAMQFKQALYSLSSSLAAGRSVENSFKEVAKDLRLLFPDPDTFIIKEFDIINYRIQNGEPIEDALIDFSNRAGIEDITNFSDVFTTCKRKGGNLNEVIRRTSNIIGEKLEIKQEISVLISQKKFEAQIIILAPFGLVALLNLSSPDYMEPLYRLNSFGPVIMTMALIFLALSYWGVQKIMDIKV